MRDWAQHGSRQLIDYNASICSSSEENIMSQQTFDNGKGDRCTGPPTFKDSAFVSFVPADNANSTFSPPAPYISVGSVSIDTADESLAMQLNMSQIALLLNSYPRSSIHPS
eukprot:1133811-Pelagomonas_calceolata.AAC.10